MLFFDIFYVSFHFCEAFVSCRWWWWWWWW